MSLTVLSCLKRGPRIRSQSRVFCVGFSDRIMKLTSTKTTEPFHIYKYESPSTESRQNSWVLISRSHSVSPFKVAMRIHQSSDRKHTTQDYPSIKHGLQHSTAVAPLLLLKWSFRMLITMAYKQYIDSTIKDPFE